MSDLFVPPASCLLLAVLGLAAGRLLRRPRLGRGIALSALVLLVLCCVPAVGGNLLTAVQTAPALQDPAAVTPRPGAVVVLAAGADRVGREYGGATVDHLSLQRVRYAAHLARRTGLPVLTSGGLGHGTPPLARLMARCLDEDFGVETRWVEDSSRNTYENARASAAILRDAGIERVFVVTHAWHVPRALASFRACGLDPVAAPTAFRPVSVPWGAGLVSLIPSHKGLRDCSHALHELIGRVWYAVRYGV